MNTIHDLYVSPEFKKLRALLMHERVDEQGILRCEYCHNPIILPYDCIAHHKTEVTMANLHDMSVTLNPDNIMLVHHYCHNKIHKRFGRIIRKVYMVWGAPRAGKTTYVNHVKEHGDFVIDMDSIWKCIGDDMLNKPNELKPVVFKMRDSLYEAVLMRVGAWENAYIITTRPDMRLADKLGAELIYIPSKRETCLERCRDDIWRGYVNDWFDNPPSMAVSDSEIYW